MEGGEKKKSPPPANLWPLAPPPATAWTMFQTRRARAPPVSGANGRRRAQAAGRPRGGKDRARTGNGTARPSPLFPFLPLPFAFPLENRAAFLAAHTLAARCVPPCPPSLGTDKRTVGCPFLHPPFFLVPALGNSRNRERGETRAAASKRRGRLQCRAPPRTAGAGAQEERGNAGGPRAKGRRDERKKRSSEKKSMWLAAPRRLGALLCSVPLLSASSFAWRQAHVPGRQQWRGATALLLEKGVGRERGERGRGKDRGKCVTEAQRTPTFFARLASPAFLPSPALPVAARARPAAPRAAPARVPPWPRARRPGRRRLPVGPAGSQNPDMLQKL